MEFRIIQYFLILSISRQRQTSMALKCPHCNKEICFSFSPKDMEVFRLRFLHGMSVREISAMMDISKSTVHNKVMALRKAFGISDSHDRPVASGRKAIRYSPLLDNQVVHKF